MNNGSFVISGKIVDVVSRRIYGGRLTIENGTVRQITIQENIEGPFILPGLIDSHIHIESSMLIPSAFARMAVIHGTVATVSDPHEIANVLGMAGIRFMVSNGHKTPFKFFFGAPSCVPATSFESSGATLGVRETEELLGSQDIYYLSEMMNFPGVLAQDRQVMDKLALAKKAGKPVDGHAPGLSGENARKYIAAGISTDHECFTIEEAVDKIRGGMKVLIREGSAARNFDVLAPLIDEYPDQVMFCSDDKHPNDLVTGHMDVLIRKALARGFDLFNILRACTYNPVQHYNLSAGLLREGDPADFILVENLESLKILETFIGGTRVAQHGVSLIEPVSETPLNRFHATPLTAQDIRIPAATGCRIRVIQALEGQLITHELITDGKVSGGCVVSDPERDILKIVVKDRYTDGPPVAGFISGFGIQKGAIASSVAHDSHNIIAVGVDDHSVTEAVNLVIAARGGIAVVNGDDKRILPLPFAGIMTDQDGRTVASEYEKMDHIVKEMGSNLNAPFMTLSFMALLVIPEIKISDKGLFDSVTFRFTDLFCERK